MKKVCVLGPNIKTPSGVSTHIRQLLDSDLRNDYKMFHYQVGSQGRCEGLVGRVFRLLADPFRLLLFCRDNCIEVLHINASMDSKSMIRDSIFAYVAVLFNLCVVFQIHGGDLPENFCSESAFFRVILPRLFKRVRLVVLGQSIKQSYIDYFGDLDIHSIPNAIDVGKYTTEINVCSSETIKLFYIGRVDETKGVKESVEALSYIRDMFNEYNVQFNIAGDGPYLDDIKRIIDEKRLSNVNLLGPVFGPEKIVQWGGASVLVFPTYHKEAMPYSIIEALASGTPMITTTVGAIPEMIEDGEHCVFVEPRDHRAVAEAIILLISDREKLQQMSNKCRQRAKEMFGLDVLARRFNRVYQFDC